LKKKEKISPNAFRIKKRGARKSSPGVGDEEKKKGFLFNPPQKN